MKSTTGIGLSEVQAAYDGPEGDLWELVMGEQIHIGGFASSMDLAERAGIAAGTSGIDLCCCNGAGMRFLVRFRGVAAMQGVDATPTVVNRCRARCRAAGLADRIRIRRADASASGLPGARADFVWGEDAWCYVVDKRKLVAEAVRLVKPGGTIAFTDWVEGARPMSTAEAERFLRFMKFPNVEDVPGYAALLARSGAEVRVAEDTGRFPAYIDLYLRMLNEQLTYDALRCIGFDQALMGAMGAEMQFLGELAHAGKIAQGIFVARRQ
ncbi:MAG: methyltransferase domain-containing protein [Planctomycetota bacterium]